RWWRGIRRIAAVLVSRQAFLVALAFVATAMLVLVFPAALVLVWGPARRNGGPRDETFVQPHAPSRRL
uniref:hypothetical protein n=1 Tax=Calditerricola satsumensis TaxID=373054 RepID=UPI0021099CC5